MKPKDTEVRDLPVGAKFRILGESYALLAKREGRAYVQHLKTTHVRLKNGREFDRRGKKVSIALGAVVEEVLE